MNIAICDDEIESVNLTNQYLNSYKNKELNIFCFTSGKELVKSHEVYDVIFLDIDMPDINGIEIARQFRGSNHLVAIIFLTNYTDYMFHAFEVHAFGYLLKPIKREELFKQLDDVLHYLEEKPSPVLEFITLEGVVRFACSQIYYFEYQNRQVLMKTDQGIFHLHDKIGELSKRMQPYHFEMPHKSFTVNLYHVKSMKGGDIFMMNGDLIPLSQKKSSKFRKTMNEFLSL